MSVAAHKHHALAHAEIRVAVITVSDTRTVDTDEGGRLARELVAGAGFALVPAHVIVPDDPAAVAGAVTAALDRNDRNGNDRTVPNDAQGHADVVLLTGGTGLSGRDSTIEAVNALYHKSIPGYGELFRSLSFAEIGPAAMLSRATAGTRGAAVIFTMPGSPAGLRLALERLILPELAHVVSELTRHAHGPVHHHDSPVRHHAHHGPTHVPDPGHEPGPAHDHGHHHPHGRHGR